MSAFVKRTAIPILLAAIVWLAGAILGIHRTTDDEGFRYAAPHGFFELAQKALFDLAIAIAIAIAVRELVDRQREKRSSIEVFREAFGTFFGDDLLQESIDSIFSQRLVRSYFEIEYVFSPHGSSRSIVYMDILAEYEVQNVSDISETFVAGIMLPNLMARFKADPLREKPEIRSVVIGTEVFSPAKLKRLNNSISADVPSPIVEFGRYKISGRQSLKVRTEVRVLKLSSDTETVRMRLPTKDVKIKIRNELGVGHYIDIEAIHAKSFGTPDFTTADRTRWEWTGPAMFLPQNGWVLYWNDLKRNPSEG